MIDRRLSRRDLLRAGTAAAGAGLIGGRKAWASRLLEPPATAPKYKTEHVLMVAFAGGVRSMDTIETPANVPSLMALAKEGTLFTRTRAQNVGHYGAQLSLYTGNVEVMGIRENSRGDNPTIFEYLRKHKGWAANDVWLSTFRGDQALNYSYSLDPEYGAKYGANLLGGDGVFNAEFREVIHQFGKPTMPGQEESDLIQRLRKAIDPEILAKVPSGGLQNDPEATAAIEKFLLEELTSKTAELTGPGAQDAKAIRVAGRILISFRPKLTVISLNNADVAHRSYNDYVEVIRRNDEELGKIVELIRRDQKMRATTSVIVVPEFGRDKDLNQRRGLDHGDGSAELEQVAAVFWGPDFKKGQVFDDPIQTIDICPTICEIFSARPEKSKAKVVRKAFS